MVNASRYSLASARFAPHLVEDAAFDALTASVMVWRRLEVALEMLDLCAAMTSPTVRKLPMV